MRLCKKINNCGFTLIEALLALFILSVIAALFPLWIQTLHDPLSIDFDESKNKIGRFDPMEVELFFQEAGMEIRAASRLKTQKSGKELILEKDYTDNAAFEFFKNNQVRRTVEQEGHVVMLYDVKNCRFQILDGRKGVKIIITSPGKKGKTYERIFLPLAQEKQ